MGGAATPLPSQPLWQAIRVLHITRNEVACHVQTCIPGKRTVDSEKIKKTIEEQLAAVMAAPIPFTVSVLIAAGLIWGAMQWAYGGIIANRDATISLVTVQRDDYLNKLKGASPEEAARQLKSLQDEIDRQKRLLDKLANPPHDPLGLYQDGVAVAAARMANLNPSDESITLQMVGPIPARYESNF
jgi:hypothetical protein